MMTPLQFKLWRVSRGMRQADLAALLECSQQMISAWEKGYPIPQWVIDKLMKREKDDPRP